MMMWRSDALHVEITKYDIGKQARAAHRDHQRHHHTEMPHSEAAVIHDLVVCAEWFGFGLSLATHLTKLHNTQQGLGRQIKRERIVCVCVCTEASPDSKARAGAWVLRGRSMCGVSQTLDLQAKSITASIRAWTCKVLDAHTTISNKPHTPHTTSVERRDAERTCAGNRCT